MDSVYANDPHLGDLIDVNSCDVISFYLNMTLVSKPSVSFTMPPGLTLLKCTIVSAQLDQQTDDFSRGNASYRGCHGYTVYCEFSPNIIWLQLLATFLPIVQLFNCQWYQKLKTKLPVICSLRCLPRKKKIIIDSWNRIKLGQVGYGCVFKGKLENDCFVAVKVLKGLKGSREEFINEVAMISGTSHVNVITLLGFCFEGRRRALINEFMPSGLLEKFKYHGDSSTYRQLGWESLYQIAVGIAQGWGT
ncbi:hypothetical protein RHMOL_Rhmol09G0152600 [Rhododendron molle]|uniref:Uncharacterized protein n=1 Tax=Rhododendron molle TaxID=49168 RepID=A0ACC0MFH3_RHOML|nr:hypothetical protein RHMOL_Rhmol09G0152600 [Rhododendron molle]